VKIPQRRRKPILVRLPKFMLNALPVQSDGLGGYKTEAFGVINYFFMFTFTAMLVAMIYISETTPHTVAYIPQVCAQLMEGTNF